MIRATKTLAIGLRAICALIFVVIATQAAAAQSNNIYEIRGSSDLAIYHINAGTGVVTTLFTNYPGGSSATLAQRPSDGMIFYAINAANGQVYRYNPATPTVSPVALTSTLGASVPASFRMAFSPSGTLYYMPDSGVLYTIDQTTGVATAGPTVTGIGSGGDMAFDSGGTLYVINSSRQLYTAPLGGGAATSLGTLTFPGGATPATLGMAFDGAGVMVVQTQNPSNMYDVDLLSLVASNPIAIGGGTSSTGDLGNIAVASPDLSITKTNNATSVYQGGPVSYTIVVTNKTTNFAVTGNMVDNVTANITSVTWTCAASAGSSCAAASGSGNTINTSATLLPNGTATYTVSGTVSTSATGNLVNTATVSPPSFLSDANPADNSATDSDPITLTADLSVTKTDGRTTINPGAAESYTIVVKNASTSSSAANGAIFTDTVPASITGVTWTCGSATLGATCGAASGSGNSINTTANLPIGAQVTYTVTGTLSGAASGTLSNTATVITPAGGPVDPTDPSRTGAGNNSATDTTTINNIADMTITKTHVGNFTQGQVGATYTLTAKNSGTANTSGTVTVTDTLPAGLTATAISGSGWTCTLATLTCTRSNGLSAGASYPVITVTVTVASNAAPSVTNNASVSGGGEANTANDTASDPTTIIQLRDMTIAKSHSGNFTQGQVGATYTVTATNSGSVATNAAVSVTDTLPAGLTATAISGTGWTCVLGTLTCTRSDVLAAGGNYPAITLTVNVANNAAASVTNTATVSGGGETNTANDTANDVTTINQLPDLTIAKSHTGNFTQGQVGATYSITATNSGFAATSGTVTVTDTLPAGLTATAISGTGWTCVLGTLTCTRGDALAAGNSYPVITLTVNVASSAPASVTNSASVSGGGETNTGNDSVNDVTTVNAGPPNIALVKSVDLPGNQSPGTDLTYSIAFTNSGGSAAQTLVVTDPIPPNTDFKIGSESHNLGTTGLTVVVAYSNDNGSTWTYTPVSGGGSAPAGYDRNVTNIRWTFSGNLSQTSPNNAGSVSFTSRIR